MDSWLEAHPKLALLVVNLFGLICIELLARLAAYYGLFPYRHFPTAVEPVLADMDPHFGVWRESDRTIRHRGACFDYEYVTNSHGMRDRERTLASNGESRAVVLGDSFVEGFGVAAENRFTDVAEAVTGVEMLNFGVSGNFGSTQEYLLYRERAAKFEHSLVALFLLPANDFADNNQANFSKTRYRPYLRPAGAGSYEVYYPVSFDKRGRSMAPSELRALRRTLYNHIYLLNAARQLGDLFERSELRDAINDRYFEASGSTYDDYSQDDFRKLTWAYRKIARLAAPRPLYIFVIPREIDLINAREGGAEQQLISQLEAFAAKETNVVIVDLLPRFLSFLAESGADHDALFLSCDGHWSPQGHRVAADALIEAVRAELPGGKAVGKAEVSLAKTPR